MIQGGAVGVVNLPQRTSFLAQYHRLTRALRSELQVRPCCAFSFNDVVFAHP